MTSSEHHDAGQPRVADGAAPLRPSSPLPGESERLRVELEQSRQQIIDLRVELNREAVENRVLRRELSAYSGSRAHRITSRVVRSMRRVRHPRSPSAARSTRPPHPLFDETFYLSSNPDVLDAGVDAWAHFDADGWRQGRDPNPLFDSDWYLARYRDLVPAGANPLVDFWRRGWRVGRNPSPWFDTRWYLTAYPDVRAAGIDPLTHFLTAGAAEGRKPSHRFSPRLYAATTPSGVPVRKESAMADFLRRRGQTFLIERKSQVRAAREAEMRSFFDAQEPLVVRPGGAAVTVIVVVWNQAALTLACLRSIVGSSAPAAVVVVDNASTDETSELLSRVSGATVISNPENVGFVRAVNQALPLVTTPYVVLLNNDATISPDSLERACEVLADPKVGAVGGRVILPNGLLQEAGSYLDSRAAAHGYLRGEPPECGNAMYRRPVDFCSGVFLALRSAVVEALGGLDEAFAPAYGEEVDLCMRIWSMGLDVVYDPGIELHHLEYGSSGDSAEPSRLMERSRALLLARYGDVLSGRPAPDGSVDRLAQARVRGRRVLVIEDRIPREREGAGFPRAAAVVRGLRDAGCFPTLLPLFTGDSLDWEGAWEELGHEVRILPEVELEGVEEYVRSNGDEYDIIWVCRSHNLARLESVLRELRQRGAGTRIVYDSECVSALREARVHLADPESALARAGSEIRQELAPAQIADLFVAVSPYEETIAKLALPDVRTCVISHSVDVCMSPALTAEIRTSILFVGRLTDADSPNVVALNWFIREVIPLLDHRLRGRVRVAGLVDESLIQGADSVALLGPRDDLGPEYGSARVLIACQQFAAGIPIKVINAAAAGVPVLATPLIASQLGWTPGEDLAVAETPAEFAAAIRDLFADDALWRGIQRSAQDRVLEQYSPEAFARAVRESLGLAEESA